MPRPAPEGFEEWLGLGREIVSRAKDVRELDHFAVWAKILSFEAKAERLARVSGEVSPSAVLAKGTSETALSAVDCARRSGWKRGQVPRHGYSPRWFYDHAGELPFAIRQGRTKRFAEGGFLRWLAAAR